MLFFLRMKVCENAGHSCRGDRIWWRPQEPRIRPDHHLTVSRIWPLSLGSKMTASVFQEARRRQAWGRRQSVCTACLFLLRINSFFFFLRTDPVFKSTERCLFSFFLLPCSLSSSSLLFFFFFTFLKAKLVTSGP